MSLILLSSYCLLALWGMALFGAASMIGIEMKRALRGSPARRIPASRLTH